ncbi:MAG TPA: 1-deoxy-D-xylulose-5-phosphate reductoisomerase [Tepidisphaeraceae bacterium]|nr:1-deoxy-D-xylulose-5-phosphate reductoisomerase [Tepidisphaeraceae bacterium]
MRKNVAVLGSTGSIGTASLEVISHLGAPYRVSAISAHNSGRKLLDQARRHRPACVAITNDAPDPELVAAIRQLGCEVLTGTDALARVVARDDIDLTLLAIVGAAGLPAAVASIEHDKPLLLANKESLVVAGEILIPEARRRNVPIIPIDSEHSAVFQACLAGQRDEIKRVILTASGGPFRKTPLDQMNRATPADALNHPTWQMGGKITIDSATMFNKALELIEAARLFDLPAEQLAVLIHPESIVHSMVEFVDGSTIAQLSPPDMRLPIQYALTYPDRRAGIARSMDWTSAITLQFEPPCEDRYPALRLGFEVVRRGGTLGAVLNAANEVAVDAFLHGRLAFGAIWQVVERVMQQHRLIERPTMEQLQSADRAARADAARIIAAV